MKNQSKKIFQRKDYNKMKLFRSMELSVSLAHDSVKKLFTEGVNDFLKVDIGKDFIIDNNANEDHIDTKPFTNFNNKLKLINFDLLFQNVRKGYFKKYKKSGEQSVFHCLDDKKCENQVYPNEIRRDFRIFLHKTAGELIGNDRNKKKILKVLSNLLLTAETESLTLLSLLRQLNVDSIKWLQPVKNERTKYILLAKFIKWLFQQIVITIYSQYHMQYVRGQRILIRKEHWNIEKKNHLEKMKKRMVIVEKVQNDHINSELSNLSDNLILFLKQHGLRSILKNKCTHEEKIELSRALCVLKHLYEINFKDDSNISFQERYVEIVKNNKNCKHKVYLLSTDISNAFGSIILVKLFNIIQEIFDKLPNNLKFYWRMISHRRKYKYISTKKLSPKSLRYSWRIEIVEKCDILHKIRQTIFQTEVIINNKVYTLCKGVGEGLMLSAILSDIYYASMRRKYFSIFVNQGYLFHYVDDSLYVTTSLLYAQMFLKRCKKGIPEYNCWFNKSKLRSNLDKSNCKYEASSKIDYLGWQIIGKSLEVVPKYPIARYCTKFDNLTYKSLRRKMLNLSALKINELIFCKEINSEEQIFNNIEIVALHNARRCDFLINAVHNRLYKFPMSLIKQCTDKIIKKIEKFTFWTKKEKKIHRKKLRYIIWKSFVYVFSNKKYFRPQVRIFKLKMDHYK